MAETLGSIIKERRRTLGLSQADLSEKLGVSVQTVSRWETNHGMPDISQIVPLAKLLCVTTDMLLGMEQSEEETVRSAFREIWESWHAADLGLNEMTAQRHKFQKASYEKLKKLAKKYPENNHLLLESALWIVKYLDETYRFDIDDEKEKHALCTDAKKMLQSILERDISATLRADATYLLSLIYAHMKEKEKAAKSAEDLPYPEKLRCLYKQAIITSDHAEQIQIGKDRHAYGFQMASVGLASLYTAYSVIGGESRKIAVEIKKKQIDLIELYRDTITDFLYHYHLCEAHGRLAIEYLRDSDINPCLDNIEKVCDHCCALAELVIFGSTEEENVWRKNNLNILTPFGGKNDPESVVRVLRNYIVECQKECTDQVSNPINTSERYKNCICRIEKYLEK